MFFTNENTIILRQGVDKSSNRVKAISYFILPGESSHIFETCISTYESFLTSTAIGFISIMFDWFVTEDKKKTVKLNIVTAYFFTLPLVMMIRIMNISVLWKNLILILTYSSHYKWQALLMVSTKRILLWSFWKIYSLIYRSQNIVTNIGNDWLFLNK